MLNQLKGAIADQWNRTSAIVGNNLESWNTKGSKVGIVDEFGRPYDRASIDLQRQKSYRNNPVAYSTIDNKTTYIPVTGESEPFEMGNGVTVMPSPKPSVPLYPDLDYGMSLGDRPTAYIARYPGRSLGIAGGVYVVDQLLNKPIEGIVDLATFNTLNLRPDDRGEGMDYPVPVAGTVPPLSAEDASREIDRLQKNIARDMLTLRQLQSMQNEGAVR